ncbi:hypothetical protein SNOG_01913 [Parastagonospora nodorum SN15]|uniref:Uncharacterized protein n=1 Tax=Phaeosphaeria nodorum (strain SN15 / ATCC MYA-4574 / FGSC 10173) TaxID=321614 RepID=Q0V251_PHANO|nr:hypothetical protein SNOG_01913 [Parastagonospora nodorum SN15]EAT90125.1 hypothetical protein SNOG_01913 [Parastagonospora nodorum SN15]
MGSVLPSELSSGLPGDNVVSHQHYAVSLGGINVDAKQRLTSSIEHDRSGRDASAMRQKTYCEWDKHEQMKKAQSEVFFDYTCLAI